MSNIVKSKALIMNSIRWKDSGKIVTLFSANHGVIKVIAKGALRAKSIFRGKLESLSYAEIIIYEKKSRGLQILSDIDVIESFHTLRAEYDRLPYAMTIMEIIQQIFEDEFNDEVFFDFVIEMIRAVGKAEDPETVLWYFLLKLSSYLGFKPQLSQCASCKIEEFSSPVHWSIEDGLLFCSSCRRSSPFTEELSVSNLQLLRKLQKYPHKKISEFKADSTKNGITALLIKYLNFHTDRHIHVNALKMLL